MVILLLLVPLVAAEQDCIYYFHGDLCESCDEVNWHISNLEQRAGVDIERFEVHKSRDNFERLEVFYDAYGVDEDLREIPAVFMENSYYIGNTSILTLLEGRLDDGKNSVCPNPADVYVVGIVGEGTPSDVLETVSAGTLAGAGFRDSVRLGMIGVWLLFLVLLGMKRDTTRMLRRGAVFIMVVFAVNTSYVMGIFAAVGSSSFPIFITKFVGIIAIFYGSLSAYVFLSRSKTFIDDVSRETKDVIIERVQYFKTPAGVIILGFIGGVLSLHQRSVTFEVMQGLFGSYSSPFSVVPLALTYVFILILPLALILVAMYHIKESLGKRATRKGQNLEQKIEAWNDHHHKVLNFVVQMVLIVVGFVLLFG